MGRGLICLWVGDVEICQELMTFMILFGFLPHSLVSVLIVLLLPMSSLCFSSHLCLTLVLYLILLPCACPGS